MEDALCGVTIVDKLHILYVNNQAKTVNYELVCL